MNVKTLGTSIEFHYTSMLFLLKGEKSNKPIKTYPIVKNILLLITSERWTDIYSISFISSLIEYKLYLIKDLFQ